MAQLALAVGGAAVGGAFGSGGAQVGFLSGSLIGAWLFAPKTTVEGPRLEDLRVTVSTYGKPIPLGFGTIRAGGNVIWATNIIETLNKKKVGGKGGPSVTQVTYTYSVSFAVAFAQREATHFLRIWGDSKLIFDGTNESGDYNVEANKGITFRTYLGTEAQDVDPLIESEKGVGNTPAYKGMVYLVFEDLELIDFSNHMPFVTAEITFAGANAFPTTDVTPAQANTTFPNQDCFVRDPNRPFMILTYRDDMTKMDLITGNDLNGRALPDTNLGTISTIGTDGAPFIQVGGTNAAPIYKFDPETFNILAGIGPKSANSTGARHQGNLGFMKAVVIPHISTTTPDVIVNMPGGLAGNMLRVFSQTQITTLPDLTEAQKNAVENPEGVPELVYYGVILLYEIGGFNNDTGNMFTIDRNGVLWIVTDKKALVRVNILSSGNPVQHGPESESSIFYTGRYISFSSDAIFSTDFVTYNEDDHSLIIATASSSLSSDGTALIKWDIESEEIVARLTSSDGIENTPSQHSKGNFSYKPQNGKLFVSNGAKGTLIDATTLEQLTIYDWSNFIAQDRRGYFWDETSNSIYFVVNVFAGNQLVYRYWLDRAAGSPEDLDDVVDFICNRVGLTDAMIDVTDLSSDSVRGYWIAQQTSARGALAPLSSAFFFDGVESDWVLKFIKAGRSGDFAIPNADLAAHSGGARPPELEERINQEIELPRQVYLKYLDVSTSYEPAVAVTPIRSDIVQTKRRQTLSYPLAFTASEAKRIANAWLYRLWTAQTRLSYSVSQKWGLVDPTDVGTVTKDSTAFTNQVVSTGLGDFVIQVNAIQEDAETYDQDIDGDAGRDQETPAAESLGTTSPIFLDTTLIRDEDAEVFNTGVRAYAAVISYTTGWRGAGFLKSNDGEEWEDVVYFGTGENVEYGRLTEAITASSNWGTWDRYRFLRVKMVNGTPTTATELAVLNGANAALLGNHVDGFELVQYVNVTDEGDNIYKLEDLLRGRRGTNNFQAHSAGDLFFMLSTDTIRRILLDLDSINASRYFAASTIGNIFDPTNKITRGVNANSKKPWSVGDVRGDWDNPASDDITVTWERRTRYGGPWLNGTGTVPLNEASEEYEADVIDGNGDVIRAYTALASETFTYTSAEQIIDFGSNQTSIRVKIYQISALVNRGFVADVTLAA